MHPAAIFHAAIRAVAVASSASVVLPSERRTSCFVSARVAACVQECARIASFVHAGRSRVNNAAGTEECGIRTATRASSKKSETSAHPEERSPQKSSPRRDSRGISSFLLDLSKAADIVIDTIGIREKRELVVISQVMVTVGKHTVEVSSQRDEYNHC